MTHELDGIYSITTTSSYQGPLQKNSDGETQITDGKTFRVDESGCEWSSTFNVLNDSEVEMVSTADPKNAPSDFALRQMNGSPTRDPVIYKTILKLQRKGDRIQMSGQIQYADEITFLTMRKK